RRPHPRRHRDRRRRDESPLSRRRHDAVPHRDHHRLPRADRAAVVRFRQPPHLRGVEHRRDKRAIVRIDPATAREDSVVCSQPDVDVTTPGWSPKRRVLTHVAFTTWRRERSYLDPMTEAMYRDLERQLPGYEVIVQARDRDERLYVVGAWSDRGQGTRYLYDA